MTRIRITEDHGPRLDGEWVRVRTGQEFGVPDDITEGDASRWVRAGFAEVIEMGGEPRPGTVEDTPIRDLDDLLAGMDDVAALEALLDGEARKGAREKIEARIAALAD